MKSHFINSVLPVFILFAAVSLFSCGTGGTNEPATASDSSANSVTKRDTAMPHEPVKAAMAAGNSVTPDAQNAKDSVGSKISIHHGKIKVVDTTKNDR